MNAKDLQTRAEAWLKARMKRLTPRQRLGLVTVLLLVYAAVPPSNPSGSHYCRKGACYL